MPEPLMHPAAAAPARLPLTTRIADYSVMLLAIILSGGSIAFFFWTGRPTIVPMDLSVVGALWCNAVLSVLFFVQHSLMIRRSVRARLATVIPVRYDGAFYAITSGGVLTFVALLYQPIPVPPLFVLHGLWLLIVNIARLLAVVLIAWTILALRTFDPFGLRPIREHLRNNPAAAPAAPFRAKAFVVSGPFRWVRHPLYSAIIILLWVTPRMTVSHFELAALWTTWMLLATLLEERDLIADFGETYRRYCKQVPMFVPGRSPMKIQPKE